MTHDLFISDEELMLAFQKGDKSVFSTLLHRHQKGLYNFLARSIGQSQTVEEAFQEVFVRILRSTDSYHPSAKFSTWLYTIARNYCIDLTRKQRFRQMYTGTESIQDEEVPHLEDQVVEERPGQDYHVTVKDLAEKLEWALQQINPDQREVFLLREKRGLPFEEIATIVGSSVSTVKSRMRYALVALQEELKKIGVTDL